MGGYGMGMGALQLSRDQQMMADRFLVLQEAIPA